jgi:hypothetical protein
MPNARFRVWLCIRFAGAENAEPKPVRLDLLAPDLAMVHLGSHKIKMRDLHKDEVPIGEGMETLPLPPSAYVTR